MSRSQVAHRAVLACLAVTLLVVIPTLAQSPFPLPIPPYPPLHCCVPEAIAPPSATGCNDPCDGQADCSDGSDETPGCARKHTCDGSAIQDIQICDGTQHCADGSDEAPDCAVTTCG